MAEGARSHDFLFKDANKVPRERHHRNFELKQKGLDGRSLLQRAIDWGRETLGRNPEIILRDNSPESATVNATSLSSGMTSPVPERKAVPPESTPLPSSEVYDWVGKNEDPKVTEK